MMGGPMMQQHVQSQIQGVHKSMKWVLIATFGGTLLIILSVLLMVLLV